MNVGDLRRNSGESEGGGCSADCSPDLTNSHEGARTLPVPPRNLPYKRLQIASVYSRGTWGVGHQLCMLSWGISNNYPPKKHLNRTADLLFHYGPEQVKTDQVNLDQTISCTFSKKSAKPKAVSKRMVFKMASCSFWLRKLGILVPVSFGARLGVSLAAGPKGYQIRRAPDTFNFLKHVMRAIFSLRPKCSHRCVSLKETPLKPVQILKHTTQNSTEQTAMRTKWFKHIAI